MRSDDEADTPLGWLLKTQIRESGAIPVADYMTACLQHPQFGYYARRQAIGADGDFITAPEISQVFGELLGLWCGVVWQQMGEPERLHLVELGPGRGTLMADALRSARMLPAFRKALSVHLVESNAALAATQRERLAAESGIIWHRTWPAMFSKGPVIVIANEFFDALPVEQFVRRDGSWRRRRVGLDASDSFVFQDGETVDTEWPGAPDGEVREVSPAQTDLVRSFSMQAAQDRFVALVIDYGSFDDAPGDSLQAVRSHRYVSPFSVPGGIDLTTHVNFARIARDAVGQGLEVDGPVAQAEFLGALGAVQRTSRLMASNPDRAADLEAGVARLLAPNGMGGRFKVMGLRSPALPTLPGLPANQPRDIR